MDASFESLYQSSLTVRFDENERTKRIYAARFNLNPAKLVIGPQISLVINTIFLCSVASLTIAVDPQEQKKQQDRASLL
jgi:hypothetical protein